ncbi:MAG: Uma2 family endonuclease, partial [Cyanobacteria bacterium P01_C01_bin.70]
YFPLPATALPDGGLSITSKVLGLALHLEQGELRFYNPATGEKLLSHGEAEAARQTAEAARQAAEDRAERLAAQLRALGVDPDES